MNTVTTWVDIEHQCQMLRLNARDVTVAFPVAHMVHIAQGLHNIEQLWDRAEQCVADLEARSGCIVAAGSVLVLGGE